MSSQVLSSYLKKECGFGAYLSLQEKESGDKKRDYNPKPNPYIMLIFKFAF